MVKQATDAEVMEYLWPTERKAQGGQAMNNPKITSVGIAAALLLFSAFLFGERAEASWMSGKQLGQYCGNDEVFSIALCRLPHGVIDKLDRDRITLTGRPCTKMTRSYIGR